MSKSIWPVKPLVSLTSRIGDGIHGTPTYTNGQGYPFINGNNLSLGSIVITDSTKNVSREEYEKYFIEFDNDTLFLSINGTLGNVAIYKGEEIILGKSAAYIKCTDINVSYLYYYLQLEEIQTQLWNIATGSTIKNLSLASIRSLEVPTPPKQISINIANVLSVLDKKIELNNRINTELEAMAKTLYDYWFVQFDFPDADGKPYKVSGGKMVYNEVLKREIPEGWEVSTLANHLACNTNKLGGNHQLKALQYLDTSSLTENVIDSFQELIVGIDKVPSRANMVVSKNDILYSTVRPNLLHYGLIKQPLENMIASTGYAVLSHKTDSSLNVAFYLHITSENNTKKLVNISQSSKSSYPSISPNDILNINIALPIGLDILSNFCNISNPIFDRVSKVQSENKKLEELRDWLLPMLMNGQVTVKQ